MKRSTSGKGRVACPRLPLADGTGAQDRSTTCNDAENTAHSPNGGIRESLSSSNLAPVCWPCRGGAYPPDHPHPGHRCRIPRPRDQLRSGLADSFCQVHEKYGDPARQSGLDLAVSRPAQDLPDPRTWTGAPSRPLKANSSSARSGHTHSGRQAPAHRNRNQRRPAKRKQHRRTFRKPGF